MIERKTIEAMIRDLEARGIGPMSSAPLLYRLLWRLGSTIPPPYFQSYFDLFVTNATVFGIMWFVVMALFGRFVSGNVDVLALSIVALCTGALFGLVAAAYVRRRASRLRLPPWCDYAPNE